jgi:hypothetical protein
MTPSEGKQIAALNEILARAIQIKCRHTDHAQSGPMQRFCERLGQRVPKIQVKMETGDSDELPAIQIHDRLSYQAVPSGTEIAPFMEALQMTAGETVPLDENLSAQLAAIDLPTHLLLYVAPQCTFCPQAVRQLLPLLFANRNIRLTVVDAMSFPELAEKDRLQSVPTLILENQFRWTGAFQTAEIVEVMAKRDPSALGPLSLEMMLKEGNASQLAEMMLEKRQIFPALYDLLIHPKWPIRLGAMVVMEQLIEKNIGLAHQIVEPLWQMFNKVDDRVKGDVLYILGQTGQKEIAPRLKKVISGEYEADVKEAAQEALDKLSS